MQILYFDICFCREIRSFCQLQAWMKGLNQLGPAGIHEWRLSTIEETVSFLCREKAKHGLHIHPCFTGKQGFVFAADRRKPGGCWFIDLQQARVYWYRAPWQGGCQIEPYTRSYQ